MISKTKFLNVKIWSSLLFIIAMAASVQAQESCKISSKALCDATATVTFYNFTLAPNYVDVIVNVPSTSQVVANAPDSDPNWIVCSIYVDFGGGVNILSSLGICEPATFVQNGAGPCYNAGGSGWAGTGFYFSWY